MPACNLLACAPLCNLPVPFPLEVPWCGAQMRGTLKPLPTPSPNWHGALPKPSAAWPWPAAVASAADLLALCSGGYCGRCIGACIAAAALVAANRGHLRTPSAWRRQPPNLVSTCARLLRTVRDSEVDQSRLVWQRRSRAYETAGALRAAPGEATPSHAALQRARGSPCCGSEQQEPAWRACRRRRRRCQPWRQQRQWQGRPLQLPGGAAPAAAATTVAARGPGPSSAGAAERHSPATAAAAGAAAAAAAGAFGRFQQGRLARCALHTASWFLHSRSSERPGGGGGAGRQSGEGRRMSALMGAGRVVMLALGMSCGCQPALCMAVARSAGCCTRLLAFLACLAAIPPTVGG